MSNPGPRTTFPPKDLELEPNTAYTVPDRGTYYTDPSGVVTHVDAIVDRTQGAPLHPDLQRPQPNTTYQVFDQGGTVDGGGRTRVATYETDHLGRTESITIENVHYDDPSGRSEYTQSRVGHEGDVATEVTHPDGTTETVTTSDYQGGHTHGRGPGGIREYINYWPMLEELNQSVAGVHDNFYAFESRLEALTQQFPDSKIDVALKADFDPVVQAEHGLGPSVPTTFKATVFVDGVPFEVEEFTNVRKE